jgi:hypothetical protein
VSQDRADAGQGCTIPEHGRGSGVTQDVSTADWRFDPGPAHCAPRNVSDSRTSQRTKRSQCDVNTSGTRNDGLP